MKINTGWRPFGGEVKKPASPSLSMQRNFQDMMRYQEARISQEQLTRQIHQIQQQGERLAQSMTIRELQQYKGMVRRFLEDTVRRGVTIKETNGRDRRGRNKKYKLLEEIDSVLLTLADELLENEAGRIELLHKLGEIRGMLINLLY